MGGDGNKLVRDGWVWKRMSAGAVAMDLRCARSSGMGPNPIPVQICSLDHRRKVVSCRTLTPFLCIFILLCSLSPADRNTPIVF